MKDINIDKLPDEEALKVITDSFKRVKSDFNKTNNKELDDMFQKTIKQNNDGGKNDTIKK